MVMGPAGAGKVRYGGQIIIIIFIIIIIIIEDRIAASRL